MTCVRTCVLAGLCLFSVAAAHATQIQLSDLGEKLFFDPNLSLNRSQSCATCHDPEHAFADSRDNGVAGAASIGDDGISLGDRNAPTIAYAFLTPAFHMNSNGEYEGGLFLDGRSSTLVDQASEPFVNPLEMRMPNPEAVVQRVSESPDYLDAFRKLFGEKIFDDADRAYRAIGLCLAAFQQTEPFAPFDSRYDRYLRGEYQMTTQEALGRELFFSQLTNCSLCHVLNNHDPDNAREPFTNYRYHNIGIPANDALRRSNGLGTAFRDDGLLANPSVDDPAMRGKFKVPTLRNVAITGPYMHNGVFAKLSTAIHFYSQYSVHNRATLTNPETGKVWRDPETSHTIELDLLREGQPLDDERIALLEAFLETLTDRRYEWLIEPSRSAR